MSAISIEEVKSFSDTIAGLYGAFFSKYPFLKPLLLNIYLFSSSNFGLVIKEKGVTLASFSVYRNTEGNLIREEIRSDIHVSFTIQRKHFEDVRKNSVEYMESPYKLLKYMPAFLKAVKVESRGLGDSLLIGDRIVLRPGNDSDIYHLFRWYNNEELNRLAGWSSSKVTADKLRYNISKSFGSDPMNLMIDNEEGKPIGTIQLYDFSEQDKNCKLGIRIGDRDYWGRGYGTDAVLTLLRFAFEKLDIYRVTLKVYEYNERAVQCYLKCGFQYEGRTRQSAFIDGKFYDEIIMGILKSDYLKLNEAESKLKTAD